MSGEGDDRQAPLCARVFDRLVDGGDIEADQVVAEHLGACVTCFRILTELRDAPRVADALRRVAPGLPQAVRDDRFWEQLAAQTTAAAGDALRGLPLRAPEPVDLPSSPAFGARGRWGAASTRARVIVVATALAAVAGLALVVRQPPAAVSARVPVALGSSRIASVVRSVPADETGEETTDVADLDGTALRRLLDRLSTGAPAMLTSLGANDSNEAPDPLDDDDRRVNDELADLDGTALRRVASSLGASPL